MKKRTLLILGCVILLCLAGWFVNRQLEYDKSEKAAIEFLNKNIETIENIEIINVTKIPTGSNIVIGYINDDENLRFRATISEIDFTVQSLGRSEDFPDIKEWRD